MFEDYDRYDRIYQPMIFACTAERNADPEAAAYDVMLGLHNAFRFASLFPQHYAFRVKARMTGVSGGEPRGGLRFAFPPEGKRNS